MTPQTVPFFVVGRAVGRFVFFVVFFFAVFHFFILAAGFSRKVAMTGVLDDHCSETFFAFSLQDSLEKSR